MTKVLILTITFGFTLIALIPFANIVNSTILKEKRAISIGKPVQRFVSLRSDVVNLRTGPGVRYPVDWVYKSKYLPVEIIAEFENWRKVRDVHGTQGWIHQSLLSSRRMFIITGKMRKLRSSDEE